VDSATARLLAVELVARHGPDALSILETQISAEDVRSDTRKLFERTQREILKICAQK
jgi:hypothetical protein